MTARTPIETRQRIAELRSQGLTIKAIAQLTGVCTLTVWREVNPYGAAKMDKKAKYSRDLSKLLRR